MALYAAIGAAASGRAVPVGLNKTGSLAYRPSGQSISGHITMANILGNLPKALLIGLVLMVCVIVGFHGGTISTDASVWSMGFLRAVHVWAGILWIGLLYYFNFVQIPTMPGVPAELKPGVTKYIAPKALLYFRHGSLLTLIAGIGLSGGNLVASLSFAEGYRVIGLGMWLGIIMAFNVWFLIWPNQKIALGIVDGDADAKAKAAKTAMIFSRTNFILSFPMLYCMVAHGHIAAA
jgi:uncharacterized membrane protein